MVLGTFIIIILLTSTYLVKKTGQNLLIMGLYVIPSFVGTIVLMTVKNTSTATEAGLLFSYYIVLSFWAAQTLGMSMLGRNVAGQTKKSVVVAMVSLEDSRVVCGLHTADLRSELHFMGRRKRNRSSGILVLGCTSLLHRLRNVSP
jgi:hypothetical protein